MPRGAGLRLRWGGSPQPRHVRAGPLECPEAWAVVAPEEIAAGRWRAEVELEVGVAPTAPGSCAGGPSQAVVRFVSPVSGRFVARLSEGEGALLARSRCALQGPRFEVGCGASLTLGVRAGEPVFVFIIGEPGPLTLEISEEVQP